MEFRKAGKRFKAKKIQPLKVRNWFKVRFRIISRSKGVRRSVAVGMTLGLQLKLATV